MSEVADLAAVFQHKENQREAFSIRPGFRGPGETRHETGTGMRLVRLTLRRFVRLRRFARG